MVGPSWFAEKRNIRLALQCSAYILYSFEIEQLPNCSPIFARMPSTWKSFLSTNSNRKVFVCMTTKPLVKSFTTTMPLVASAVPLLSPVVNHQ